ncbi:hypothetical protein OS493_017658 [Desmophyllum pertusum]|uniref:Uncharacterized protein n=1 Tax=Desmophyllum pertusum TaxID=174260 RepID=A0A9W9ZD03_9CNID|nr:hypothetical protein OS493_017658 [Desmophyllum pertusum]
MNMRGLFKSEFLNITQKAANYVVINGFGRLPSKYQETLLELRCEVFENIDGFLANIESFSSTSCGFCAILEPEIKVDNQFSWSSFASQERIHNISVNTTISQIQEIPVARKRTEEQTRPIFEQPSLQYCLGPGTHGQRLLNSTLIRAKALSDPRLQSSRETQDYVVTSLPHRLSVHTGKTIEGESHFGIMELTWRAGTPLAPSNDETSHNAKTSNYPQLSGTPVEQKRLDMFRAVNSLHKKDSLVALSEYIKNQNIIKKNVLDKNGNLLPGSFTDAVPQPPNTTTPMSFQVSPALHSLNNDSLTSVRSDNSSGRCSRFYELAHDMTRDTLLSELNRLHLPPIWKVGGHHRSP